MESLLWRLSVSVIPLIVLIGSIYIIDMLHRRRKLHVLTTKRRGRLAAPVTGGTRRSGAGARRN